MEGVQREVCRRYEPHYKNLRYSSIFDKLQEWYLLAPNKPCGCYGVIVSAKIVTPTPARYNLQNAQKVHESVC